MEHSASTSFQTSAWSCDPLDDMEVSASMERYFKVRAALAFLLRGQSSPERVFKLYELPMSELDWFSQAHPQEAEEWVTAYLLKVKAAYVRLFLLPLIFSGI